MKFHILATFSALMVASTALANGAARSPNTAAPMAPQKSISPQGVEVDFSKRKFLNVQPVDRELNSEDIARLIPQNLASGSDGVHVESNITRHVLRNISKSETFRGSTLFRTVTRAAQSLKEATSLNAGKKKKARNLSTTEVETKNDKEDKVGAAVLATQDTETDHNFQFKLEALKRQARLTYSGYVDSTVTYYQKDNSLVVTADKQLTENSLLQIRHTTNENGSAQTLNYNLTW